MFRRSVKIAYIGGGSKAWARSFMQDLALAGDLAGEVALATILMLLQQDEIRL